MIRIIESGNPKKPKIGRIPYVNGILSTGSKLSLYNCTVHNPYERVGAYSEYIIYAEYAFFGLTINSEKEPLFKKVSFDFDYALNWFKLCDYKWRMSEGRFNLIWESKDHISRRVNDNLTIQIVPCQENIGGVSPERKNELVVKQYISTDFEYDNAMSIMDVMSDALCVRQLIGFGVRTLPQIKRIWTYLDLHEDDRFNPVRVEIVPARKYHEMDHTLRPFDFQYDFEQAESVDAVKKWYVHYPKLKPVLDLYFTAISNSEITDVMRFLNVIQALETFHARFVTNNLSQYKEMVNDSVHAYYHGSEEDHQGWKDFLLSDKQKKKKKEIILYSRLAHLCFADGILPFMPRRIFIPTEYMEKVVVSRNYYTHYDEKKAQRAFDEKELKWVVPELIALLEYHILIILGFDQREMRKNAIEKLNRIGLDYQLSERV